MAEPSILLSQVVPALGALISTLMYAAPVSAVLKANKDRNLGVSAVFRLAFDLTCVQRLARHATPPIFMSMYL